MNVLGEQWAPVHPGRWMLDRVGENVRHTRSEIVRELTEEEREILLRRGRDGISPGAIVCSHVEAKSFTVSACVDGE
jgi:hypothetical protein